MRARTAAAAVVPADQSKICQARPAHRASIACLLLALLTASGSVGAQGSVAGTVLDDRTGLPAQGVSLRLGNVALGSWSPIAVPAVTTATDGTYLIAPVPAGSYILKITPPAPLLPMFWPDLPCYPAGNSCSVGTLGNLSVANGATFTANAAVGTAGAIRGRLLRSGADTPIAGAVVNINRVAFPGSLSLQAVTDEEGRYARTDLPSGNYRVYAARDDELISEVYDNIPCPSNCAGGVAGETLVNVASDLQRDGIDFALSAGAAISGYATETGVGTLVEGLGVRLSRLDGGSASPVASMAVAPGDGAFAFTGLLPGGYTLSTYRPSAPGAMHANEVYDNRDCAADQCAEIEIAAGTSIELDAGETRDDIELQVDPAGSIAGCVTSAGGAPLGGVTVVVAYVSAAPFAVPTNERSAVTGLDGCYAVSHLRAAPASSPFYLRTVNTAGYADRHHPDTPCLGGACDAVGGTPIALPHDADLSDYSFVLPAGDSIAGQLTGYPGGPGIAGIVIELYDTQGQPVRNLDRERIRTRADGSFGTYGLAAASFHIAWTIPDGPFAGRYVHGLPRAPIDVFPWPQPQSGTAIPIVAGQGIISLALVADPDRVHRDGFESP